MTVPVCLTVVTLSYFTVISYSADNWYISVETVAGYGQVGILNLYVAISVCVILR